MQRGKNDVWSNYSSSLNILKTILEAFFLNKSFADLVLDLELLGHVVDAALQDI